MLWPPRPCAVAKAAAGPESEVLSQDACRSAAAMAARKAMPSLTSWVCPSALGAPLRTPAREERLPEPAAKPGARCRGQWCHKWPQGQHHLAEDGEELQELHLTGLKAVLKCSRHLAQSLVAPQEGLGHVRKNCSGLGWGRALS